MKSAIILFSLVCAATFCGSVSAQVYELLPVPGDLPAVLQQRLSATHNLLAGQLNGLLARAKSFNGACATVPADSPQVQKCQAEESKLQAQRAEYNRHAAHYNQQIKRAGGLSAHSAVVWLEQGKVTLTRHGHASSAAQQNLETGDCISVGGGGVAELILPRFTDLKVGSNQRFCYEPQQQPDQVIGVLGYLYHWENGREIKKPIEVAGVRG